MELKEHQVKLINEILSDYEKSIVGKDFVEDLIYALAFDLDEVYKYEFVKSKMNPVYTDVLTQTMYYNPKYFLKVLRERIDEVKEIYPEIDSISLYNFFVTGSVLHEISHVEQGDMAYNHKYDYEEIARLYRVLFDALNKRFSVGKIIYSRKPKEFFHERNAEIEASLNLARIYEGTELGNVATNLYVSSLFKGYDDHGVCPARTTFVYVGLPYGVDMRGIPFKDAFYHGATIDTDKYNKIVDFLGDKTIDDMNAIEIDRKIRSLG